MEETHPDNREKIKQVFEEQIRLSDDLIIEEILTRLPIKSILRFKSVSKRWYSTLSSSKFATAHFTKSPLSHPSAPVDTLFILSPPNCYLFSHNDDDQIFGNLRDNLTKLDPEFWSEEDELTLAGCCNGLICLTSDEGYFIIWNPATRKMHKYEAKLYKRSRAVIHGFGYASSVDEFKYVEISSPMPGSKRGYKTADIFSLRENKWRRIKIDDVSGLCGPPVLINGTLYWHAFGSLGWFTIKFDLRVERLEKVKSGCWECLGDMGECLSRCICPNICTDDPELIHVFECPGIRKSVGVPGLKLKTESQMIGFTKTGNFFVTGPSVDEDTGEVGFRCDSLGIVDTAPTPMQYTKILNFDGSEGIEIARYVPSLFSPSPVEELPRT